MKAITLWQPWASLVPLRVKPIETRSWNTNYRGPLAIHASKRVPSSPETHGWVGRFCLGRWAVDMVHAEPCDCDEDNEEMGERCADASGAVPALFNDEGAHGWSLATTLPLGAVVATCTLVDCVPTDQLTWSRDPAAPPWRTEVERSGADHVESVFVAEAQRPYGDFTPGRFAWLLADIDPVNPPVPAKGKQGLWEWDGGAWLPEHGGLVLL